MVKLISTKNIVIFFFKYKLQMHLKKKLVKSLIIFSGIF